jgi:hypothetical protein
MVMSFLERTIEGPNAWAGKAYGWKYRFSKRISITEYHFWFWIFIIMFGILPMIVSGFSLRVFGFYSWIDC